MDYLAEFRAYPKDSSLLRTFQKEFKVSDELGFEQADAIARNHMEYHALQYRNDHPDETCTLENIYRCELEKEWVLTYERH
jgi:hypothetical protein